MIGRNVAVHHGLRVKALIGDLAQVYALLHSSARDRPVEDYGLLALGVFFQGEVLLDEGWFLCAHRRIAGKGATGISDG